MKKSVLTLFCVAALTAVSVAQCDTKIVFNSSKTDHLVENGTLTRSVDETALVEIDKANVNVSINGEQKIIGNIKSTTCNWTVPFKEGKTVIKATTDRNGEEKTFTMTLEGKGGKVTLYFEMEGEPGDKVRVMADKFEAAKS